MRHMKGNAARRWLAPVAVVLLLGAAANEGYAKKLRVAVLQTVIENTLSQNLAKLVHFISQAKEKGCRLVIFPECALYWSEIAVDDPTRADMDAAVEQLGRMARSEGLYVTFCTQYRPGNGGSYRNRALVYGPGANRVVCYDKNTEVPQRFYVDDVPCNVVICSDRGYLEHSDLPCLVQGSQVIIDTSGGHGGDDGRPDLRWIRYRPWALRTNAYVIVCNPVHADTDFMGHSLWGGGSAIIKPDGWIQASLTYEKDAMIVDDIDLDEATRAEANRRRNHPLFKPFWDMGEKLLDGQTVSAVPDVLPYSAPQCSITIAAAQVACSANIRENIKKIQDHIRQAAEEGADIVVFPELAVTGYAHDDVLAADEAALDDALMRIRNAARTSNIHVIVGTPAFVGGRRCNCAVVIGADGSTKTRYAQITVARTDLFEPGLSTEAMWFRLKGVPAIVTVGEDAKWVEIGDLAASRGMYLHFHISHETDASEDGAVLRKQKNLLMLRYAKYGAVVNAADPSQLRDASFPAGGTSMIVSREGGHDRPSPGGLEYYLPYQTSVVCSAGRGEEIIYATRNTATRNDMDLGRFWRNRNRKARAQKGWYEWMENGALAIKGDSEDF